MSEVALDNEAPVDDENLVPLDTTFAITRAAMYLDEAMQMARDIKSPEAAVEVVNAWLAIAVLLDEEDDEQPVRKHKTGFHHGPHED